MVNCAVDYLDRRDRNGDVAHYSSVEEPLMDGLDREENVANRKARN